MSNRERENGATVIEKLAHQRYIRDITITDMSKKIGIHRACLSNYELGKRNVPFDVVEAMCEILGYEIVIKDKRGNIL